MGKELFDRYPQLLETTDAVLGYSLKTLCLKDPDKHLNLTRYTQPALYVVSTLTYMHKKEEASEPIDQVAGHSLGEFSALFAAGVFDFETGLRLVQKRGELMAAAGTGGMAAVMNLSREQIEAILHSHSLDSLDIANINGPSQIVLSGPKQDLESAMAPFEQAGARFVIIKVNSPFHSRYMKVARTEFANFLQGFRFNPPEIPVIANVTARPYEQHDIIRLLSEQITSPVNWLGSIRYLLDQGETSFVECGPGKVLTGLIRSIRKEYAQQRPLSETEAKKPVQVERASRTQASKQQSTSSAYASISPIQLGSRAFRESHGLKYAYLASALDRGVSSSASVIALGKSGLLGFYGAGGLELDQVRRALDEIQEALSDGQPYGMSLLCLLSRPALEAQTIDLYLERAVTRVEAANYLQMTASLVRYRLKGLYRDNNGKVVAPNHIIAQVTRPEVATLFMSPAPRRLVDKLLAEGLVSQNEAELAAEIPMATDICAAADSGGPTDQGVAYALMPAMVQLRDEFNHQYHYATPIRLGASGGIGTPEAAAAAFILGADFVGTRSINQASVEAATSDTVKDMLVDMNLQDTTYAPAAEMFEMGARIQVLKRGLFFPARASKLFLLYQQYASLEELGEKNRRQIQEKYFKTSFEEVWTRLLPAMSQENQARAERHDKYKMLLTFKWYFQYSWELAIAGSTENKVDYQVYCGPSMGAFNQWIKGSHWEADWRPRRVLLIAEKLMRETATLLERRFAQINHTD